MTAEQITEYKAVLMKELISAFKQGVEDNYYEFDDGKNGNFHNSSRGEDLEKFGLNEDEAHDAYWDLAHEVESDFRSNLKKVKGFKSE